MKLQLARCWMCQRWTCHARNGETDGDWWFCTECMLYKMNLHRVKAA